MATCSRSLAAALAAASLMGLSATSWATSNLPNTFSGLAGRWSAMVS